jgi:hypothetical protein
VDGGLGQDLWERVEIGSYGWSVGIWGLFRSRRARLGSHMWFLLTGADGRYIVSMSDDLDDMKNAPNLDGKFLFGD